MADNIIGNTLLNRFRVDSLIASRGNIKVYRGWDLEKNIPLALKEVPGNEANISMHFETSELVGQPLNDLAHPNIVPLHGIFRAKGVIFIVEAFIEGSTLKEHLKAHTALGFEETLAYMKQLCDALFHVHTKGIIHGNLKPGNIFIKNIGELLLADFGLSQYAYDQNLILLGENNTYTAPEQIRGETVTTATDIYALGIILFEMLTGEHPFQRHWESLPKKDATNPKNEWLREAHLKLEPINPSEIKPEISQTLSEIILRALEKDSSSRHQSAQDFFSLVSAQHIQQNNKISKASQEVKKEDLSLFRRFLSVALKLRVVRKILAKEGKTELATALLDECELAFPLASGDINFDDIFINRRKEISQMHVSLQSARQGIILVFGHRRVGKTVYVKTALDELGHRLKKSREILINVSVNLPSIPKPEEVLHIILGLLKDSMEELEIYNSLNQTLTKKLDVLLKRLENEINTERRLSAEAEISVPTPLSVGVKGGVTRIDWERPKESFFSDLQSLCQILKTLQGSYIIYHGSMVKLRIVLTIDELDKVENITAINTMLNDLKSLFSAEGVHLVLIISAEQYNDWTSQQKEGNVYDSLSSGRDIYIDCMWDMRRHLSLVVNENNYFARDDILFYPGEFFQHYLKYLSVKARGNLDKLWHDYIMRNIKEQGGGKFLAFSREEIREIKLYSGLYDMVAEIMETEMGDEADRRDRDIAQIALCQTIVNILDSKRYGIKGEDIIRSVRVSNQALGADVKKMVEILISKMVSKEYIDQSERTYYLKKRRVIEKGSHISAPLDQIATVSNVQVIDVEREADLLATEQKEAVAFLPPVTNYHAILEARNNTVFLTVTDEDPMRFSYEDQWFYEKLDIGRGSENDLQVHEDINVSRYHLRLVFSDDGWYIHDMNTANGTLINGIPTTQTFLSDGDVIFMGDTVLKFQIADKKNS